MRATICLCALAITTNVFAQSGPLSPTADAKDRFRLLTYNVWYGFTKVPDRKSAWLDWVGKQEPDVVVLQELNTYTDKQLASDAALWGHAHSVLLKEDGFPTGITSRTPISDIKRFRDGFHHGLMRVRVAGYYVYVVHLHPSNWEVRIRETKLLLDDAAKLPAGSRIVVAGDFNTFSPKDAKHYSKLKDLEPFFSRLDQRSKGRAKNLRDGRLDYTPLRLFAEAGFVDQEARFRNEFQGTFPTRIEKEGEHGDLRRLDYVLTSPNLSNTVVRAWSIVDQHTHKLSDHYPVMMDVRRADSAARVRGEADASAVPPRLVIAGGGSLPGSVFEQFRSLSGENPKLVVIPTASRRQVDLDEIRELWKARGFDSVQVLHSTDRKVADTWEFVEPLSTATAVWFGGGSQQRIADAYLGTRTEQAIYNVMKRGGVIGGSSAGAAIQTRVMIASGREVPRLSQGLGLLPNAIVDQHFLRRNRISRLSQAVRANPNLVGYGIDEGTAMVVGGEKIKVVGRSYVLRITEQRGRTVVESFDAGDKPFAHPK